MIHFRPLAVAPPVRTVETEWEAERQRMLTLWQSFASRQPLAVSVEEIEATAGAMRQHLVLSEDALSVGEYYGELQIRCYAAGMLSDSGIAARVIAGLEEAVP